TWVRTQAVPILITGTPDVDPLPATYEIDRSHDDERTAIGAGSYATAEDRYRRRLGAASVRMDLPELIAGHPDKPDRGPIDRWVATLSDDEILERMGRFRAGRTVAAAERTFRLVDGMLAEVRAFEAASSDE
ncbi:MAG TPA: hypothetical protein VFE45_16770, partial [Coriobacteriia bacterium]|nr:hypothetical protein [Coriobacteriia bacterium]